MKIKHFAGYGSVRARKISEKKFTDVNGDKFTEVKIEVRGNHERGIEFPDWNMQTAFGWLVMKHFGKSKAYDDFVSGVTDDRYERTDNGIDEEVCVYTFIMK